LDRACEAALAHVRSSVGGLGSGILIDTGKAFDFQRGAPKITTIHARAIANGIVESP
jgi:hypothetical protein